MSDRILQKYVSRSGAGDASEDMPLVDTGEDAESFGCFGFLRGVRDRAICLELRKKSGQVLAVNYAFIGKFEFDPSVGIVIHYGGAQTIRITGRNLNHAVRPNVMLFQAITRFRVPWIQEADRARALQVGGQDVVVESIEW